MSRALPEMVVGTATFQRTPSVEKTLPLSRSKVYIRKLSSSCNFKVCLCRVIYPFARFTYRAPSLSRAGVLTHTCQAQNKPFSQTFQAERTFHRGTRLRDLQSLQDALKQPNPLDDTLHSYDESQELQRLKCFLNQHAEPQPKRDGGLEEHRLPKAATGVSNSKTESVQDYPARNQQGIQSSAASGSPQPGNTYKNRNARVSKHRGRRISSRGLDVLDNIMASQGHTSRALLESLQSTVASNDDGMTQAHFHGKPTPKVHSQDNSNTSYRGKVSRNESVEKMWGGIDTWKPTYDTRTDNAATSTTFASSLEKAISPSTASSTNRSTLASSTNGRILEQNMTTSSSEAYSAGDSDVVKPSLRGQEVLLALQKAAMEKAKLKQRTRKVSDRSSKSKEATSEYESGKWRDAKPIIVKPEWAQQIDELERRIEDLKNPLSL